MIKHFFNLPSLFSSKAKLLKDPYTMSSIDMKNVETRDESMIE